MSSLKSFATRSKSTALGNREQLLNTTPMFCFFLFVCFFPGNDCTQGNDSHLVAEDRKTHSKIHQFVDSETYRHNLQFHMGRKNGCFTRDVYDAHRLGDVTFHVDCPRCLSVRARVQAHAHMHMCLCVLVCNVKCIKVVAQTPSCSSPHYLTHPSPPICKHTCAHTHSDRWLRWVAEHVNA